MKMPRQTEERKAKEDERRRGEEEEAKQDAAGSAAGKQQKLLDKSIWTGEDWLLSGQKDQLESVIQQLEEVIRIKEQAIDRLTMELSEAKDQSIQLEGKTNKCLALKEDRIEELEEALRESVRITADREVALDAETQQRTLLDQKVHRLPFFCFISFYDFIKDEQNLTDVLSDFRWVGSSKGYSRCIMPRASNADSVDPIS